MGEPNFSALLQTSAMIYGPALTPSKFLRSQSQLSPQECAKILKQWATLRADAGLPESAPRRGQKRVTHDDLMVEYDRVRTELGKDPTWSELNRHASFSRQTYQDRVGRMDDLKRAHREWVELRDRTIDGDEQAASELKRRALAAGTIEPPPSDLYDFSNLPGGWMLDPNNRR